MTAEEWWIQRILEETTHLSGQLHELRKILSESEADWKGSAEKKLAWLTEALWQELNRESPYSANRSNTASSAPPATTNPQGTPSSGEP